MPWHPPLGSPDGRRRPHVPTARAVKLRALTAPAFLLTLGAVTVASDVGPAGYLIIAAYLLVAEILAVFGSAAEVALEHHSRSRVVTLAAAKGSTVATERRLEHLPTLELTARLVRFLGHALLVTGITYLVFRGHLPSPGNGEIPWSQFAIVLAILFALTFLVNGVLVRVLIARRANSTLLAALPYLEVLGVVTWPLRIPLVLIVRLLFRVDLDAKAPSPREEILETVEEGEREGSFTSEEADMIESIIEMETSLVKDVLTPRADVVMLQADASLEEAVALARGEGYSRVPVYGKDRDDVIGVLYAHDLLAHWRSTEDDDAENLTVRQLMRTPFFVPENKPLNDLLREMRARKVHMAVVLDEFNGTEGLVTIEDLLEEIVGEIEDEYDTSEEDAGPSDEEKAAGIFRCEGRATIDEVNERYEIALPEEEDFDTLGGLVFHRLGKVPEPGEKIEIGNVIITVVEADERMVLSVLLRVLAAEAGEAADGGPAA